MSVDEFDLATSFLDGFVSEKTVRELCVSDEQFQRVMTIASQIVVRY